MKKTISGFLRIKPRDGRKSSGRAKTAVRIFQARAAHLQLRNKSLPPPGNLARMMCGRFSCPMRSVNQRTLRWHSSPSVKLHYRLSRFLASPGRARKDFFGQRTNCPPALLIEADTPSAIPNELKNENKNSIGAFQTPRQCSLRSFSIQASGRFPLPPARVTQNGAGLLLGRAGGVQIDRPQIQK